MKNILFVSINSKYIHTNLAILYLRKVTTQFLESRKHLSDGTLSPEPIYEVASVEYTINQFHFDILADIVSHQPDIIAFSLYIWNSESIKELLSDLPNLLPQTKIVLGGPEVSYNSGDWLAKYPTVSYIVKGGGERAWQSLLQSGFQGSSRVIQEKNLHINDVPFPYDDETLNDILGREDEQSYLSSKIIYYESSRGCPFRCSFCLSSRLDIKLEYRSLDKVKEELEFFIANRVSLVKFIDRTFNSNPKRAREIWSFLLEKNVDSCFHFEVNPYLIMQEDIDLLQKIPKGWFQFEIGIQSTYEPTLKEIGRYMTTNDTYSSNSWDKIARFVEVIKGNIDTHLDLVFGLPFEGYKEAQDSFNYVYRLKADTFQAGMLKVLPGTEIAEKTDDYQMLYQKKPPYRVLQTKWIRFEELHKLYRIEHLLNNLYNSHRFERTLNYLERVFITPFALFDELETYWQEMKINYWLKDWIKTSEAVLHFFSLRHNPDILIDCLRYDLCFHSGLQSYPPFLIDDNLQKVIGVWQRYKRHNRDLLANEDVIFRRGLVFKPFTTGFKKLYQFDVNKLLIIARNENNEPVVKQFNIKDLEMSLKG